MNVKQFQVKMQTTRSKEMLTYRKFNDFWKWKLEVESSGKHHILDNRHVETTCDKLLDVLPSWQTWRGVRCEPSVTFPIALRNIADDYNKIRKYDLLSFNSIPDRLLTNIWHELGKVKTPGNARTTNGMYHIIAICKPLMFLWGQTLPFDSVNRKEMREDKSLQFKTPLNSKWMFVQWNKAVQDLQRELLSNTAIISYVTKQASNIYGPSSTVPYGRFLDIYYYKEKSTG